MVKAKFLILLLCSIAVAQQTKLTSLGPNGGIITLIKGSPDDAVILSVVKGVGLYRSIDGGEKWNKITLPNVNPKLVDINDIAFHPISSDTVLMVTSIGLFYSSNKGLTWTASAATLTPRLSIAYTPANSNVVFGSDELGVLRSNDGGRAWFPLKDNTYFGNRPVYKIAIHPSDSINIRVLVSTGFADTVGIFFTPNGGQSWIPLSKGLPPINKRRIYAIAIDTTGIGKTHFRSIIGTANGMYGMQTDQIDTSWNAISFSDNPIGGIITGGVLVYDRFDPISNFPLFSFFVASNASEYDGIPQSQNSENGLFKIDSHRGTIFPLPILGDPTINKVFNDLSDIFSIFVSEKQGKKKIYIGTSSGISVSDDLGISWLPKNNGISQTIVRNLSSQSITLNSSAVYAGIFGAGVFCSMDDGITWKATNFGISNPYVTTLRASKQDNSLYAGSVYGLYRSTNFGASWDSIFIVRSFLKNPAKFITRDNEMTVRISPKNPNFILLYTKATGLYLSKDGAVSWSSIKSPLAIDSIGAPEHFEFDPVDSLTIYYGGYGLYKSIDLGQTWIDISGNLPKNAFSLISNKQLPLATLSPVTNSRNPKEILIATVFGIESGEPFKIFKTIDGGNVWNALPVSGYSSIFDRFDSKRILVTGPLGIFGSDDGGVNWKLFSDSSSSIKYFLVSSHESNQNIFYIGSESGAHRLEYTEYPKLSVDRTIYDFGNVFVGKDSLQLIPIRNQGSQKLLLQFSGLGDTLSFRYLGSKQIVVLPGDSILLPVMFIPASSGLKTTQLKFSTNDLSSPTISFLLNGQGFIQILFERLIVDFGSVLVGKDSIATIVIDNTNGLKPLTLNYLGKYGDSLIFNYLGQQLVVDSGKTALIKVSFTPKSAGEKIAYVRFATSDLRYPVIQYRLRGVGILKNFVTRKILLDTTVGFVSFNGSHLTDYYKLFTSSLQQADINVHFQKAGAYSNYNAVMFVLPSGAPPKNLIDSLQQYVVNGGSVILVGDFGKQNDLPFNTFLQDTGWVTKFKTKTGIRFNSNLLFDSTYSSATTSGIIIGKPERANLLTYKVDSIIALASGSLSVDTSLQYVSSLISAKSPGLYSVNMVDSTYSKIISASIAAVSKVGKGKIVAVADYDLWWNGFTDDTTLSTGVFSGKNLQLGFNILGIVDNLTAQLPDPTPKEEYQLISIPYSFADSSVEALFKDLGKPNKYLWRMFGKYNQRTGYAEFPDNFRTIKRGEGYWIITKEKMNIDFGTTSVQGTEEDFEIKLNPGYNMIGNPFPYDVSWKNSYRDKNVESVLWSFVKGDYDSVTQTMEKFKGYWVKNNDTIPRVIRISSAQLSTASSSNASVPKISSVTQNLDQNEWKMQIGAQSVSSADSKNFIGMLQSSVEGYDDNDFSEPPVTPTNYISLSFKRPKGRFAADYRAINTEGDFWDFDMVSSAKNVSVDLSFTRFGQVNPKFKFYLLDNKQERVYDISQLNHFLVHFDKSESQRSFRLIVGTDRFVEKNSNGVPLIPIEYELYQNFPNPFNPSTTLQYSISHSGFIFLEVFNVLGQKIKTLVQEFQPIGRYSVHWDGKNNENKTVSSGIYYYRLRANEFTSIKKMTFIK